MSLWNRRITKMITLVTAYEENRHLLQGFLRLADKFYPRELTVDVAPKGEPKASQLLRMLKNISEEYVILLEEDFYFIAPVRIDLLDYILDFCSVEKVDRFSLQSKNCYKVREWKDSGKLLGPYIVYQVIPEVHIHFSLEASIWRRDFLQEHLGKEQNDEAIELQISEKIRYLPTSIYALDFRVIEYRDVLRRGKQHINSREEPRLHLLANDSDLAALYPEGEEKFSQVLYLED